MSDWYLNIEEPIREIVKKLRNNGVNTFCSCGHGMWIQCESYESYNDLNTIYNVLVGEMNIKNYRAIVFDHIVNECRHTFIEIQLCVDGKYYQITTDNPDFKNV